MSTTLAQKVNGNGAPQASPEVASKIQLIKAMHGELEAAIPPAIKKVLTPERITRLAITAMRQVRNLDQCTFPSIAGALMVSAQLGLEPCTPLGHCYLIPRKNGRTGQYEATFQIGYPGMLELAYRTEVVLSVSAQVVYANDVFVFEQGLNEQLIHRPCLDGERGHAVAYYAVIKFTNGGHAMEVMTHADMVGHMQRFAPTDYKTGQITGPWATDFDEMAKKTMIRRLFKFMRKSTDLTAKAAIYDERVIDRDAASNDLRPQFETPDPVKTLPPPSAPDPEPEQEPQQEQEKPSDPVEETPSPKAVKASPKKASAKAAAKAPEQAPVPARSEQAPVPARSEQAPVPAGKAFDLPKIVSAIEDWFDGATAQMDEQGFSELSEKENLLEWMWTRLAEAGQVKPETKHLYSRFNELARLGQTKEGTLVILESTFHAVQKEYGGEPDPEPTPEVSNEPKHKTQKPSAGETLEQKRPKLEKWFEDWANSFSKAGVQAYAMPQNVVAQAYFQAMSKGICKANAVNYRGKVDDIASTAESADGVIKIFYPIVEAIWEKHVVDEPGANG